MRSFIFFFNLLFLFLLGCKSTPDSQRSLEHYVPQQNTPWQYQLTGALDFSSNARLYDIDLEENTQEQIAQLHEKGLKVICYFSAGSAESWRNDYGKFHPEDLGKELDGWEGERWLDINSDNVLAIMKNRLDEAQKKGCDGVEVDNVDGFANDTGLNISARDQLRYNKQLAKEAHQRALGIGLKNDMLQADELVDDFDFAINEQCFQKDECKYMQTFIQHKKAVFNVEYAAKFLDDANMTRLCNRAKSLGFETNILPRSLDGSFRYSCSDYLFHSFGVGFGSSDGFKFHKNHYINIYDILHENYDSYAQEITDFNATAFHTLSAKLQKTKYTVFWLTKGWKESWFDVNKLQKLMDEGYVPVFIYWYFGDHLAQNGYLQAHHDEYLADVQRAADFVNKLKGDKFFILEPEFNKQDITQDFQNQQLFISTMKHAIAIIKEQVRNVYVSLAMMDTGSRTTQSNLGKCGYAQCALGDKAEWSKVEPFYDALANDLDFLSFEEMVGQFSRDPNNPGTWENPNPIAYNDEDIGIRYLAQRVENLAVYLRQKYHKPVFLAYTAIATATWNDANSDNHIDTNEINASGWVQHAKAFYHSLHSQNLFGYAVMELFDDPSHDVGGYQFFINNEYHLGIVGGGVQDGQLTGALDFKSDIISEIFKGK